MALAKAGFAGGLGGTPLHEAHWAAHAPAPVAAAAACLDPSATPLAASSAAPRPVALPLFSGAEAGAGAGAALLAERRAASPPPAKARAGTLRSGKGKAPTRRRLRGGTSKDITERPAPRDHHAHHHQRTHRRALRPCPLSGRPSARTLQPSGDPRPGLPGRPCPHAPLPTERRPPPPPSSAPWHAALVVWARVPGAASCGEGRRLLEALATPAAMGVAVAELFGCRLRGRPADR